MLTMMTLRSKVRQAPLALWAYLGGTAGLVALSFIPSSVATIYTWRGGLVELFLLIGLFAGSRWCRWILIGLGIAVGLGSILVQSVPLDPVATAWAAAVLLVTALLLLPSSRRYASGGPSVASVVAPPRT
jgi:hypothetical protein